MRGNFSRMLRGRFALSLDEPEQRRPPKRAAEDSRAKRQILANKPTAFRDAASGHMHLPRSFSPTPSLFIPLSCGGNSLIGHLLLCDVRNKQLGAR
jgi:hypothetical protein